MSRILEPATLEHPGYWPPARVAHVNLGLSIHTARVLPSNAAASSAAAFLSLSNVLFQINKEEQICQKLVR
jgi:hypothetical protein